MPSLTRRRCDNPHRETWDVSYGDVRVGTIGERAGIPVGADQWGWSCGFYPGLEPRRHRQGTAKSFIEARAGFEADWHSLLPELSDDAFEDCRRDRAFRAEIRATRARGEKLPTEIYSSLMRCVCGVVFDSHKPDESYDHRGHIHAAYNTKATKRAVTKRPQRKEPQHGGPC
ncbi:hypothetical protein [Bradyrhizobium sp.]|uniref:hypothetical protein n=1 Tax=Bradyrhizobium sp. TaxID=376 RepID=UPI00260DE313|nr:hypothetical protein [Bradyrhizobium sp.]